MENSEDLIRKIRAGKFRENNGKVLRTINHLRIQFVPLKDLKYALPTVVEGDILDSINYLQEAGYIRVRHIETHAEILLADADPWALEAKLSHQGILLLEGSHKDPAVIV